MIKAKLVKSEILLSKIVVIVVEWQILNSQLKIFSEVVLQNLSQLIVPVNELPLHRSMKRKVYVEPQ